MSVFLSSKKKPLFTKLKWDILAILLLGLLSLTWFRGNNLINGGDFGMPFDWVKYFKGMFSVWIERNSLGAADYRNIASVFPYATLGALMQSLGFSLVFIEKIFFYFWFAGGGLSMYFLCSVLGMKRLGKLTASVFFMLNPFSLIVIWRVSHGLIQMPYSFAPLVLGLYIYGLKKKLDLKFIFSACLLWLFMTGSAYANPRMVVAHWLLFFFYFLSVILYQPQERSFTLKFSLKFLAIWLGLNFYWLFPFVYSMSESFDSAHLPSLMNDIETLKLTSARIIDSIRMFGYWALHSGYKGDPYHPYEAYYRSFPIILISWLTPLMVLFGFLDKDSRKKPLLSFFIVTIFFGIIGMAGPYSPLGGVLISLYKAFPSLALLTRFTVLFFGISTYTIFGVLLGYGFLFIYEQGRKLAGKLIFFPLGGVAVLLFVVLVWPFWTGEVIARAGRVIPGERVKIPPYWWEAKKWFSEQKGFYRILSLPMSQTYNMVYHWEEGYSGGDPIRWLSDNPVLFVNNGENFRIPALIGKTIEEEKDFKEAGKLLGMVNVKYVLYRKDIRWDFIAGHNSWFAHTPQKIEKFLKSQVNLRLVKTFGPWEVYELNTDEILPHVYIPQKIIGVSGEVEGLEEITQFINKEKIFFIEDASQGGIDKITQNFIWQKPQPSNNQNRQAQADYKFSILTEGEYEIFLENDDFQKYLNFSDSFAMKIDNNEIENRTVNIQADNLIDLGKINLAKGDHFITILLPPFINLAENSSFEDAAGGERSEDAFDGKRSLKLTSRQGANLVSIPISVFNPGISYNISFSTKNISGELPFILLWENIAPISEPSFNPQTTLFGYVDLKTLFSRVDLPAEKSWKDFNLSFKPNLFSKTVGITFVSNSNGVTATENLFDKLEIYRLFDNPLVLQRLTPLSEEVGQALPEMKFRKISPVKYEVEIRKATKPFFLVFSEAFHPKWMASVTGEHFMVNGFANGWYISKLGDYKFTISFALQRIYYFSIGVSLAAVLLSLGYLLLVKIRISKSEIRNHHL